MRVVTAAERAEFAARRRRAQDDAIARLLPYVTRWLEARRDRAVTSVDERAELLGQLRDLYRTTYRDDGGTSRPTPGQLLNTIRASLRLTPRTDHNARLLATLLVVATQNAATVQAAADDEEPLRLEWVTMHDHLVRDTHRVVDGQQRRPGETFTVAGEHLLYPGQPVGDPAVWINCRCTLAPVLANQQSSVTEQGVTTMTTEITEPDVVEDEVPSVPSRPATPIPWHGVLAPENKWSGDGRRFAADSLSTRDLPLPLTWQKTSDEGHKGSTTVAKIEGVERVDGEMRAHGTFLATREADEVVGLLADFGRFGVSVDADDAEFEYDDNSDHVTFTHARISSASIVAIPAFAEAWVTIGTPPDDFFSAEFTAQFKALRPIPGMPENMDVCNPDSPDYDQAACDARPSKNMTQAPDEFAERVSNTPWSNFTQSDYSDEQWRRATILDRGPDEGSIKQRYALPIREPSGVLNRNGVHAAAASLAGARGGVNADAQAKAAAARRLRGAYATLGETPPDSLKSSEGVEEFRRGPGWITNPEDTRRIHDYWTKPGHAGYAKIAWGTPGDFDRCRVEIGQEIAEHDPATVARYMNQICAQWHHDATGFWPGHAPAERGHALVDGVTAAAISLTADGGIKAPAPWFANPHLTEPTHLTITDEGQVFGHIAQWGVCHIGFDGVCVTAPPSQTDYAYFATGQVALDDGRYARTGVLSLGGGHAGRGSLRAATEHYDSTSCAVADVAVGEDEHGIWCAGWVRPGTTDEQITALRASDISGDWREVGGNLEMVAALAVNVGGFPVARVTEGTQVMLVAAGVLSQNQPVDEVEALADRIAFRLEARQRERIALKDRMAELVARVRGNGDGM